MSNRENSFYIETLGCPKNQVDSDKLVGTFLADGLMPATSAAEADVVVVNTCAFISEARDESIDTILSLGEIKRDDARLVVTGCMAERYGDELAAELPEADQVAGFGVPVSLGPTRSATSDPASETPSLDLLELPRPTADAPWAYLKVAEGCDRNCGFCSIPSFRGKQRSRSIGSILDEARALETSEIVLVAQDLASFGRDQGVGERQIVELVDEVAKIADRVRLLYLYPSDLTDALVESVLATGVPYFDLSLQHVSRPLVRRMRRWGEGQVFLDRIESIRRREPEATFRSNFIVGYPGETESDQDELLDFVERAQLDWCGFFAYSDEEGTYSADLDGHVSPGLVSERMVELSELQDRITSEKRDALIGRTISVLVDTPGVGRSHREAPEIDGLVRVPTALAVGTFNEVVVVGAEGPDLIAERIP